jgi:hypothetical protein
MSQERSRGEEETHKQQPKRAAVRERRPTADEDCDENVKEGSRGRHYARPVPITPPILDDGQLDL